MGNSAYKRAIAMQDPSIRFSLFSVSTSESERESKRSKLI
jgi:hypothetical protein